MTADYAAGQPTAVVGAPVLGATAFGEATTMGSGAAVTSIDSYNLTGNDSDATICVAGRINAWPADYSTLIDKGTDAQHRDFAVFFDTSGNVNYQAAWQTASGGDATVVNLGLAVGTRFVLVVVAQRSDRKLNYWLDGAYKGASGAITASSDPLVVSPISLCYNASGGGAHGDATFSAAHAWTRALNAAEIAMLASDPFCFMRI